MDHHAEENKGKAQFSREEADAIVSEHARLTAELARTQAQIQHAKSIILSMSQYAELKKEIKELRQEVAGLKAASGAPEYYVYGGVAPTGTQLLDAPPSTLWTTNKQGDPVEINGDV